ncbi:MAG: ABC transporter permease [Eubacteriales bacterium]|nr:ABC transporter permease [Eubacteriales bacterium]
MRMNPVYKRETMVSARSFRLALVLLVFNGILALVALLNMYSTLATVRLTAEIQYTSFLDLYVFVAVLEFMMLIFIMPAITAGSISGERERQTLELMLTTQMTPSEIVFGKLAASLSTMFLMIISSFPIISMVFVYGGVTVRDICMLLFCYVVAALFVGSMGLCCSALFKKSTLSTVVAYGMMAIVVIGTYGVNLFAVSMSQMHRGSYLVSFGQSVAQGTSGGLLYLLLVNPAATFLVAMVNLTGQEPALANAAHWFGVHEPTLVSQSWLQCSIAVQLTLTALFIWIAVQVLRPGKGR